MKKSPDKNKTGLTVEELAHRLGCSYEGDPETKIYGVSSLEKATEGDLVFLSHSRYKPLLEESKASVAIIPQDEKFDRFPVIKSPHPQRSFIQAVKYFFKPYLPSPGTHPRAVVSPTARVGKGVSIGALSVIGEEVEIGEKTVVFPGVTIYPGVKIGEECIIHSGVSIREGTRVGNRVIIHNGVVVGSDGFGYLQEEDGSSVKIPQKGKVIIEDDVEIGANTTIDRASLGETIIRKGVKIDNLVQVAHNVEVGENSILAAQTGIAGSTKLGKKVIAGGQVGITDHVKIGDKTILAAKSGVTNDVSEGEIVAGSPHLNIRDWRKAWASLPRLHELIREFRKLKKKVEKLEK